MREQVDCATAQRDAERLDVITVIRAFGARR
jgi:hypothetical protein